MKLTFTGQPAMAAAVILAGTSLRHLVSADGPIRSTDVDGCTLEIDLSWRFSSGEHWFLSLLGKLARGDETGYTLSGIDDNCDSDAARVCREAVALLETAA